MQIPRFLLALACAALPALGLAAADPVYTLAMPAAVSTGGDVTVELILLNPTASPIPDRAPVELAGRLVSEGKSWPVVLREKASEPPASVPAGGFVRRNYVFSLPADVNRRAVLELEQPTTLRAVVDVAESVATAPTGTAAQSHATTGSSRPGLVPRAAASHIERTFREHFEPHEPVYFIYGPEHPGAKFQLSFKYRIFGDSTSDQPETTRNSLQFGYTQRSLWDITANSAPFVDTSYMPELFYEHLAPEPEGKPEPFTWLGFQTGFQHESNGKDGANSRSLNILYLRPAVALGELGGWRVIFAPRFFSYILDMSDNSDLNKYRGYTEARVVFGRNDGPELTFSGRIGTGWDHFTYQLDLSYPLRFHSGGFASYFLLQYFNGYGESLIHYTDRSEVLRAGFSFVR